MRRLLPLLLLASLAARAADPPLRVRLVTGGHDHEASFYAVFESQPDLRVTVQPHPSAFSGGLPKNADVLVLYDMVQDVPEPQKKALAEFIDAGKGLVVLHHAMVSYQNWDWYRDLVGGRYRLKAEGDRPASAYKHDQDMAIRPVGTHPIVAGLKPFRINDETYRHMFLAANAQPLLETDHPESDRIIGWVTPHEKARVVYLQLGHGRLAHESPHYRDLVRRAILWAGGRLPGEKAAPSGSGGR